MSDASAPARAKSPSYPNYSLKKALDYAGDIFTADRRNPIDRSVAMKHMGYSGQSGAADKAIATMMQYGLLEKAGKGEVRVSQLAIDILHPDRATDRPPALVRAAFGPPLFKTLKDRFPDDRFSDDALRSFLMREGFLERAISPVLNAYSETIAFLQQEKATESGGASDSKGRESASPDSDETVFGGAQVGDLIQWEANGVLQLETPKRVRLVTDDGKWVCVDGSETGIPMEEVIVQQKAPASPPVFPLSPKQDNVVLQADETEWMRNKVGQETNVRLLVKGKMGPKEIGKLIKLLEAQRAVLEDDDEEAAN